MKTLSLAIILAFTAISVSAQKSTLDSLCADIDARSDDTLKVEAYLSLSKPYVYRGDALAFGIVTKAHDLSIRLKYPVGITKSLTAFSLASRHSGSLQAALDYGRRAYQTALGIPLQRYRANALNAMSIALGDLGRLEETKEHCREALAAARSIGDLHIESTVLNTLGRAYTIQGKHDAAMEIFDQAIRLADKIGDNSLVAGICSNIGNVQTTTDRKLAYYERALQYFEKKGDKHEMSQILNNIATAFIDIQKYHEAFAAAKRGYNMAEELGNHRSLGVLCNTIGSLYRATGDYQTALKWFRRSIENAEKTGEPIFLATSLLNIARTLCCDGNAADDDITIDYALRAVDIGMQTRDLEKLVQAYRHLASVYTNRGDFQNALRYIRLYADSHDSLTEQRNNAIINELSIRYETDRREREFTELKSSHRIQQLELERRALEAGRILQHARLLAQQNAIKDLEIESRSRLLDRNLIDAERRKKHIALLSSDRALQASLADRAAWQRNSAVGAFLFLAALSLLGYRRVHEKRRAAALRAEAAEYKSRAAELETEAEKARSAALAAEAERREKEQQKLFSTRLLGAQERERKRIASELHDGLGQSLLLISHRAQLALARSGEHNTEIRSILDIASETLRDVRRMSRDLRPLQLERVGLTATLRGMLDAMSEGSPIQWCTRIDQLDDGLREGMDISIFRIVQEGLSNILRHAHARRVELDLRRENGRVHIRMADDGIGFDQSSGAAGLGLRSIAERVQEMGGSFSVDSAPGNGTCLTAEIPVSREIDRS